MGESWFQQMEREKEAESQKVNENESGVKEKE